MSYTVGSRRQAHADFDHDGTTPPLSDQSTTQKQNRRRSSKIYQCPVESCGRVYSRGEHLSRHQLNHTPKEIFRCDVPNCSSSFVRADLHCRHRTRHMSEYLLQRGDLPEQPRASQGQSAESAEFMDPSADNMLTPDSHSQAQTQYAASTAQISCEDVSSTTIQQPQTQSASTFIPGEVPGEVPVLFNQLHQNANLSQQQQQLLEIGLWRDEVQAPTTMPFFGGSDSYARSPFTIPDDFIQFLFNGDQPTGLTNVKSSSQASFPGYTNIQNQLPGFQTPDIFSESYLPQLPFTQNTALALTKPHSMNLSNEKSQEIFDLVRDRLTSDRHAPSPTFQDALLQGDRSQDLHIMSQKMMQDHVDSYWRNFHSQLPILHRSSFCPNRTPNLLLIAVMILGSSCSPKSKNLNMANSATEFAAVLAWYLRWEIFGSMHIQSDNLWVFQTLLLLETYEKTYSSRTLHERAHIHHATAITLMRRGSFLTGRSPLDSPPDYDKNDPGAGRLAKVVTDVWWEEWIRREATRRVAFAAFMIDSMHAAMFGHSMIMVAHEMRLILPCDDALWSATSFDEVRNIEMTLRTNGVKPLSFLEGLQRTLNGQEIHTNAFGRSALLCGLLSVSWHMSQRDMQISSLDIGFHEGKGTAKWRRSVAKAHDLWRESYELEARSNPDHMSRLSRDANAVLGSRSALYYLAQFSLYVDIVECQVFAGATRVLGRVMGKQEVDNVRRRMRNTWARSTDARKATFYALRFLCSVLRKTDGEVCDHDFIHNYATSNTTLPMHRWVLYSAALIVWCYSYAVDGPSHMKASTGRSIEEHIQDMQNFLRRVEHIKSTEDVAFHRLNGCAGLLTVLCYVFRMVDWELLHEGADLLARCVKLINTPE